MRVSGLILFVLVFLIIGIDYFFQLGISAFLGDFLVVFIVVGIFAGVIGIKTGK